MAALQPRYADDPRVMLIEAAVTDTGGTASFTRRTISRFSGRNAPSGLTEIFPGLKDVAVLEVPTLDARTLLDRIRLPETDGLLLLDMAGDEEMFIAALAEASALECFAEICLTLPTVQLFENAADGPTLEAHLAEHEFQPLAWDRNDPDLPLVRFGKNRTTRLERHIKECQTERDNALAEIEQAKAQLSECQTSLSRLQPLTAERDALSEQVNRLNQELEGARTQIATVTAERDTATARLLERELARLADQLDIIDDLEVRLS
ncbi:hypothetical protein [Litorisediminicola beolgyonensis]|uniref:Chromosome partition protein Smc n=1 Tax=Litorisediminicola beolgyonensis TaxID=1173614 RepID=A0ABW3ZNM5_9RHOB